MPRKRSKKKQASLSRRPKPTAVNHDRLAEKCKQSGVPHFTVEKPQPATRAVLDELFGLGPVLFTGVRPGSGTTPDKLRKEKDGGARCDARNQS